MKKIIVAVIILCCFLGPAEAQEFEHKIYLPLVRIGSDAMSEWFIIVPDPVINRSLNPSAEIAGNYGNVAGGAVTRVTTASFLGVRAYRLVTGANNDGGTFTLDTLANAIHYVTMRVRGTLPPGWDWSLDNANFTAPILLETYDAEWSLYGLQFSAAQAGASTTLRIYQDGAGAGDFNIDSIQVEEKEYWTTACDGDQEGCEWLGTPHASTSQRSAQSRAGGRVRDLQDDYHLDIGQFISTGMPPLDLAVDSYAILPGGELNSIKVMSRVFTLTGVIRGTSTANLHANKQALLNVLKPGAVPGDQPVRIRYTGAAVVKQIAAHYESGLETSIVAQMECWERVAIRFLADDPFWYGIGNDSEELDVQDVIANTRYVAGWVNGAWSGMGPPTSGDEVRAMVWGPDKNLYVGGDFLTWNGDADQARITMWNPRTLTWSPLQEGATDGSIYALVFGPDGTLYAGGSFTSMDNGAGPVANTPGIAAWDGTNWSALSTGVDNNEVRALAIGSDGSLYAGGTFLLMSGVANTVRMARWTGVAPWQPMDTGFDSGVFALAVARDGTVYAGGAFTVTATGIAYWDGAAWNTLGTSGANAAVYVLEIDHTSDILYLGGIFTQLDGVANLRIAKWTGTAYEQLGDAGLGNAVWALELAPDGELYVGGLFGFSVMRWSGTSWSPLDWYRPAFPCTVYAIVVCEQDPVVEQNYDVYLGFSVGGAFDSEHSGDVTITNDGTESAYPNIIITRDGVADARLVSIRNETTGKELLFDYSLLDGETLTIDLTPTQKSIISNFFGPRPNALLPNSDFGSFVLQPGVNTISCFVHQTVAPMSAVGFFMWESTFWSND